MSAAIIANQGTALRVLLARTPEIPACAFPASRSTWCCWHKLRSNQILYVTGQVKRKLFKSKLLPSNIARRWCRSLRYCCFYLDQGCIGS